MVSYDVWFSEKARELVKLEREYLKYYDETKMSDNLEVARKYIEDLYDISLKAYDLRNEILKEYHHIANLQIYDNKVKEVLKKVKGEKVFYSVSFFEDVTAMLNKKAREKGEPLTQSSFSDYLQHEIIDELRDEFHSRYHFLSYFESQISIGPIISSSKVPEIAQRYFNEIREAYALDLSMSCIALCRALFEMCLYDKLKKRGFVEKRPKVEDLHWKDEYTLAKLIGIANRNHILNKEMKNLSEQVKNEANNILHIKDINQKRRAKSGNTFSIICNTIKIVEYLYQ